MHQTTSPKAMDTKAAQMRQSVESTYRERLLRVNDMCIVTSMSRSALYLRIKEEGFPKPVRLHGSALAWRESEVVAWIAALPTVELGETTGRADARGAA